jgi:hypothetical protein
LWFLWRPDFWEVAYFQASMQPASFESAASCLHRQLWQVNLHSSAPLLFFHLVMRCAKRNIDALRYFLHNTTRPLEFLCDVLMPVCITNFDLHLLLSRWETTLIKGSTLSDTELCVFKRDLTDWECDVTCPSHCILLPDDQRERVITGWGNARECIIKWYRVSMSVCYLAVCQPVGCRWV